MVLNRREREALAIAEAELLASHALAEQAAQTGDEELFLHLLVGNDKEWVKVQRALLARDLLFSHALRPFGLTPEGDSEVVDVRLAPDLTDAEVDTEYRYAATLPGREPLHVVVRQTNHYRRGQQRWLLASTGIAAVGRTFVASREHVTVHYEAVDEEFALALLDVLEEKVAVACEALGSYCPPSRFARVRLDRDPRSLLAAGSNLLEVGAEGEARLPAPSLAGVPVDEQASHALLSGYAARVVAIELIELIGYRCCEHGPYFAALLARQLGELGLPPLGVVPYDATEFVDDIVTLPRLNQIWWGQRLGQAPTEMERKQVDAFAEFLLGIGLKKTSDLLAGIPRANGFWDWLRHHTPYDPALEQDELATAWQHFVLARANASQDGKNRPSWPEQELALVCEDASGQRSLFLYDPAVDEWQRQQRLSGRAPTFLPTPDDRALVLYDRAYPEFPLSPPRLWQQTREAPLPLDLIPLAEVSMDPQGRYLTMQRGAVGAADVSIALLDLASCGQNGDCVSRAIPSIPYWSPDGASILVWDPEQSELLLGKREEGSWFPTGITVPGEPFWLDEITFGYLAEGGETVDVRTVTSRGPGSSTTRRTLFSLESLESALAPASFGRNWQIVQAVPLPHTPAQFLVALGLPYSSSRNYLLVTPREEGESIIRPVSYLSHFYQIASLDLLIGDEGHLLAFYPAAEAGVDVGLILFDLVADRRILEAHGPFFYYGKGIDWSRERRWLARTGDHFVEFIGATRVEESPVYRHFVATDQLQCSSVAWLTPETRGRQ
jgi:hypothetical protein